ncbi:hypothetical protein ACES2L_10875 [Bdellovibrio bacteriovorus]
MEKKEESTLDKVVKPVLNGLRPRIEDPFLSVYSASFLIWNYQIFIFMLSNLEPLVKYRNIQHSLNLLSFLAPIVPVVFINFIFPRYLKAFYSKSEQLKTDLSSELNQVKAKHITFDVILAQLREEVEYFRKIVSEKETKINEVEFKNTKLIEESASRYAEEKIALQKEHRKELDIREQRITALISDVNELRALSIKNEKIAADLRKRIEKNSDPEAQKVESVFKFLKEKHLINNFETLVSEVLFETRFYLTQANKQDLAIFLTKNLFSKFQPFEHSTDECLEITELGKKVYEKIIDTTAAEQEL